MRLGLFAAIAALTMGVLAAGPASANWECQGAAYVCGDAAPRKAAKPARIAKKAKAAPSIALFDLSPANKPAYGKRKTKSATSYSSYESYGSSYQSGVASYYWQPQRVASGGWFNPNAMTAAHKTLPFGTRVRVTHVGTGKSVEVRINDRGPYIRGRIIDLSSAAAGVIGMKGSGVARVQIAVLGK